MRFSALAMSAAALALVAGCSSSETPATGAATGAPPPDTSTTVMGGTEVNPDGVAYPTADQGYKTRSASHTGNRIANYKFLGYLNGDKAGGLKTISLADYFDPEMKKYKLIHIIASSAWCGPCIQETEETTTLKDTLLGEKVVFVQALIDGPKVGTGAVPADLDKWISSHGVNFTAMLDPDVKNLGQFFSAAAVPWNANIDARSMEILTASEGATADIAADARRWTKFIDGNPAKP